MTVDLAAEFNAAVSAAKRDDFDALIARGVSSRFLWREAMRFGVAEIAPETDGSYQPVAGGRRAFIVPALPLLGVNDPDFDGSASDIGDLIAFDPAQPERWWCRTGIVPLLNPFATIDAVIFKGALKIWPHPLAWLRADGEGVVVLDPGADLRFWLSGVPSVHCSSLALGREIAERLRRPIDDLPEILVARASAA